MQKIIKKLFLVLMCLNVLQQTVFAESPAGYFEARKIGSVVPEVFEPRTAHCEKTLADKESFRDLTKLAINTTLFGVVKTAVRATTGPLGWIGDKVASRVAGQGLKIATNDVVSSASEKTA